MTPEPTPDDDESTDPPPWAKDDTADIITSFGVWDDGNSWSISQRKESATDESTEDDYAEAQRRFDEAQAELLRIREEWE